MRRLIVGISGASGSFKTDGMVIAPSAIANSYNDNLLVRAGDYSKVTFYKFAIELVFNI